MSGKRLPKLPRLSIHRVAPFCGWPPLTPPLDSGDSRYRGARPEILVGREAFRRVGYCLQIASLSSPNLLLDERVSARSASASYA